MELMRERYWVSRFTAWDSMRSFQARSRSSSISRYRSWSRRRSSRSLIRRASMRPSRLREDSRSDSMPRVWDSRIEDFSSS